jgi:hypothetical protein
MDKILKSIGEFKLGKVDGKEEFLFEESTSSNFFDAFFMPQNVDLEQLENREIYFISGFRGTGKTSLLRYFVVSSQPDESCRSMVLFKSDIGEEKRTKLSTQVGISLAEYDSKKMGIAQDFKSAWCWFFLHQVALMMEANDGCYKGDLHSDTFLRMMGFAAEKPFKKIMGFLPKLEGAKVRLSGQLGIFSGEVDLEFENENSTTATVLFSEVVDAALACLERVQFVKKLVVGIDELEVFFFYQEQYSRDLAMVRDLIFSVDRLNQRFRMKKQPIILVAAIRKEVVDAIGVLGQEVNRVVHDRGVNLTWHHAQRSLNHPLIEMIRRKMKASLPDSYSGDPIVDFFDDTIDGEALDSFLLDRSFYRPRDMIWRLTFAQKSFPKETKFGRKALGDTESDYSAQLWSEIEYELSASFSVEEIEAITAIFSGIRRVFFLNDLSNLAQGKSKHSDAIKSFIQAHSLADLCRTLYSHGALGNDFRTGTTGNVSRNRWIFRGDRSLIVDQRMTLNPALRKALSAIDKRKRGSR